MSIHVHRNSFNAGELSPLMDARVDEAKHPFSCRIMENFIPKIYGGAFRRPGTMYLATQHALADWVENVNPDHRLLFPDGNSPPPPTVFRANGVGLNDADWVVVTAKVEYSTASNPTSAANTTQGFSSGSVWVNLSTGAVYTCSSADGSTATWVLSTAQHNKTSTTFPIPSDDSGDGYQVGSLWFSMGNFYSANSLYLEDDGKTVYKVTSSSPWTWTLVTVQNKLDGNGPPTSADNNSQGFVVNSVWVDEPGRAVYVCTASSANSATWVLSTAKNNLDGITIPTSSNNSSQGYTSAGAYTSESYWVRNNRKLWKRNSTNSGILVWTDVTGTSNLTATRPPSGADIGHPIGDFWVWEDEDRAWELTSLTNQEPIRLFDFNVSATTRYILAFGDGYVRIYNDDGTPFIDQVNSPNNLPLQLATPYLADDLFEVQIAQLGNLAYFAHPKYPPQKLERSFRAGFNANTFQWSRVNWSFPAFRDTNNSGVTAAPSATSGSSINISFTADPFVETLQYNKYTGARIMLSQRRAASHVKQALGSTASSSAVNILGAYQVFTYGTFTGTLRVQAKDKAGAWTTLRSFEFTAETGGRQIVFSSATQEATDLRLDVTHTSTPSGASPVAYLEAGDSRRVGYARISDGIGFNESLPVVDCAVQLPFDSTAATTEWAIEAWAEYAGWPRAVCFHEQRLWFGGTELQPNTIWASATGDYENFRRGAFDNDALAFTLAAQEGSAIQSLVSHSNLVIFTQSEEWTAATSQQTAITPSNIFVRRQSRFGSTHRQAFVAANNLLFLQRGARKLRQFSYGQGGEGVASDLTLLAEHITRSGIRQMAFQQQPDPIIWAVRNDGVLLSLTYEPDQSVIAWARHTSGTGLVESVAVIYGDEGDADQVWLVVNRGGTRLIERFDPDHFAKLDEDNADELVYVDSAVLVSGSPSTTISGLSHLNGSTVAILADAGVEESKVVSSGQVSIGTAASVRIAGIPYVSRLQPSKIEVGMGNGTAQGRRFVAKRATLNLWKTFGAQYADDPSATDSKWFEVLGRSTETNSGEAEPLYTGMVDITNLGAHKTSIDFTLRQTLPLPCNILAVIPKIEVLGT
jgi:hypothetical protein